MRRCLKDCLLHRRTFHIYKHPFHTPATRQPLSTLQNAAFHTAKRRFPHCKTPLSTPQNTAFHAAKHRFPRRKTPLSTPQNAAFHHAYCRIRAWAWQSTTKTPAGLRSALCRLQRTAYRAEPMPRKHGKQDFPIFFIKLRIFVCRLKI